jgi:hypothetical protein
VSFNPVDRRLSSKNVLDEGFCANSVYLEDIVSATKTAISERDFRSIQGQQSWCTSDCKRA